MRIRCYGHLNIEYSKLSQMNTFNALKELCNIVKRALPPSNVRIIDMLTNMFNYPDIFNDVLKNIQCINDILPLLIKKILKIIFSLNITFSNVLKNIQNVLMNFILFLAK
jgi:hypothetical protein